MCTLRQVLLWALDSRADGVGIGSACKELCLSFQLCEMASSLLRVEIGDLASTCWGQLVPARFLLGRAPGYWLLVWELGPGPSLAFCQGLQLGLQTSSLPFGWLRRDPKEAWNPILLPP